MGRFAIGSCLAAGLALSSLAVPARANDASRAGQPAVDSTPRIAAISGVHEPHQGFALSATVPSDRMCLELAQNLASELGIVVHVVCTEATGGRSTVVAECGYAESRSADRVGSYSHGWGASSLPFLICVPPPPERFRARRVTPAVEALRPTRDGGR